MKLNESSKIVIATTAVTGLLTVLAAYILSARGYDKSITDTIIICGMSYFPGGFVLAIAYQYLFDEDSVANNNNGTVFTVSLFSPIFGLIIILTLITAVMFAAFLGLAVTIHDSVKSVKTWWKSKPEN